MLAQLYILPGEQGRGIGSALLAKAMARRPAGMRLYAFQRNTRARGFYERRGFVAVEFGDGSGNEEGEPDVLYQWTPASARRWQILLVMAPAPLPRPVPPGGWVVASLPPYRSAVGCPSSSA